MRVYDGKQVYLSWLYSFPSSSLGMQTWKLQLPVLRSWSFGFAIPKLELGNQKNQKTRRSGARACVSGALVADAGNACSRLRLKSLIPAYANGDEILYSFPSCTRSQAPAWECRPGSSSFPSCEAGASASRFPSWSLGTRSGARACVSVSGAP